MKRTIRTSRSLHSSSIFIALGTVALGMAYQALAGPIGLINTGTDGRGNLLPDGSVQPGWTITSVTPPGPPGGLTPPSPPSDAFVVPPYPSYWMPDSASSASRWISYSTPLYQGGDIFRDFIYQLTFYASQGDNILMRVSADNGTKVYLNQETSSDLLFDWSTLNPGDFTPFSSWSPWFQLSGLDCGDNTIICDVSNLEQGSLNPTGLRAEFMIVPACVVPERHSLIGEAFLVLLAIIGGQARRFRKVGPDNSH